MKNIFIYIFQERIHVLVYVFFLALLGVYFTFVETAITSEIKTISKYSENEIMVQYPNKEYEIFKKGSYVQHGNLITRSSHGKSSFLRTWSILMFSLLGTSLAIIIRNAELSKLRLRAYFDMKHIYVDYRNTQYHYIFDGVVIWVYPFMLPLKTTLSDALIQYYKHPENYENYE